MTSPSYNKFLNENEVFLKKLEIYFLNFLLSLSEQVQQLRFDIKDTIIEETTDVIQKVGPVRTQVLTS